MDVQHILHEEVSLPYDDTLYRVFDVTGSQI